MNIKQKIIDWSYSDNLKKVWALNLIKHLYSSPWFGIFSFIQMFLNSYVISFRLFGFSVLPRVYLSSRIFRIAIDKSRSARITYPKGIALVFEYWGQGCETRFILEQSSHLIVGSRLVIGDGCKIHLNQASTLTFGGGTKDHASGITCNSIILCMHQISIGKSTLISWGVYISDSSQHKINGTLRILPVVFGSNVWISEGVTCGPGTEIGKGSIIGAKSYVNKAFPCSTFLAGAPARIIKQNINWSR